MKIKLFAACLLSLLLIISSSCKKEEKNNNGLLLLLLASASSTDAVGYVSQSALDTMNDSMSNINNSGQTDVSFNETYPGELLRNLTWGEKASLASSKITDLFSANAAPGACPGGGSYEATGTDAWGTASTAFYVTRTFTSCKDTSSIVSLDGTDLLYWSGMSTSTYINKLQNGSKLQQAPINKRFTRVLTSGYMTAVGNGATITSGSNSGKVAHTVTWTAGSPSPAYTIATDVTRTGYSSSGTVLFIHTVTTPTPLSVTANLTNHTRTISGTIRVAYTLANINMDTTFTNLTIPMATCVPTSGTATIVVSGAAEGSGTITFGANNSATYSYTNARNRTATGSFTVAGCQ